MVLISQYVIKEILRSGCSQERTFCPGELRRGWYLTLCHRYDCCALQIRETDDHGRRVPFLRARRTSSPYHPPPIHASAGTCLQIQHV